MSPTTDLDAALQESFTACRDVADDAWEYHHLAQC